MLWLLPCALQVRALRDIACLVWSPIYRERRTAKPVQVHAGGACGLRRARLVGCTADAYGDWHDEGRKALWVPLLWRRAGRGQRVHQLRKEVCLCRVPHRCGARFIALALD
jgi:hypothetical protein